MPVWHGTVWDHPWKCHFCPHQQMIWCITSQRQQLQNSVALPVTWSATVHDQGDAVLSCKSKDAPKTTKTQTKKPTFQNILINIHQHILNKLALVPKCSLNKQTNKKLSSSNSRRLTIQFTIFPNRFNQAIKKPQMITNTFRCTNFECKNLLWSMPAARVSF